jgi:hypothetical protein
MRDYGKVYSTFWSSVTTGDLSDSAKLLACYLMTCSHSTIAGVFRLPDGYVSEDLKWPSETVAKGFAELFAKGFANRCETTKWVWVTKHLDWNKPENPNQRKSAAKIALSIPDACSWKPAFMRDCAEVLDLQWTPPANPQPTLPQGLPNQEQKQKQEQKQEQDPPSLRSGGADAQARRTRRVSEAITLKTYLEQCKEAGQKPVPDSHPIRSEIAAIGISTEMLQVAWIVFRRRYTEDEKGKGKRYKDWPAHFANAVRGRWGNLWIIDAATNTAQWSSNGMQEKAILDAKARARGEQHEHA